MTKVTMELTGGFSVSRASKREGWSATASIDLDKVPETMWLELAKHGLKQKIADSASQAKTANEAQGMMNKAIDAIIGGLWSTRGAGEGLSDMRSIAIYRLYVAAMDADTRKRFNKAFDSQAAKVRKALESAASFTDDAIAGEIAVIEAEREAAAIERERRAKAVEGLAGKIDFNF